LFEITINNTIIRHVIENEITKVFGCNTEFPKCKKIINIKNKIFIYSSFSIIRKF
jgi:hypothetical protein